MKEKIRACSQRNPTWGYGKIAETIGCHKSTVQFHLNPRSAYKKCSQRKDRIRRLKLDFVKELGGCCSICGYKRCISALEFHHRHPDDKKFNIFRTYHQMSKLREEIAKCILVCANCHREIEEGLTAISVEVAH